MNYKKTLISFIGSNDSGNLQGKSEGAIFNTLKILKFDEVHMIWIENYKPKENVNKFLKIGNDLKKKLIDKSFCKKIIIDFLDIKNPIDHNEIYPKLLEYCNNLDNSKDIRYTAAISSGTPAMQVCWILMAESGDFEVELIRTNEPIFGENIITPIKLGTGLPIIRSMKRKIKSLQKEINEILPELKIYVKSHKILIGDIEIKLSQMEFSYYRYFAEKARRGEDGEYIPHNHLPLNMARSILKYHIESFPHSDSRIDFERDTNGHQETPKARLNENISNIKRKMGGALIGRNITDHYVIRNFGSRKDGNYLIKLDSKKIKII